MPCCVVMLVMLALPRLAIFLLWLMTNYISSAYDSFLIPLIGFFFMPYTTLGYAWAMHNGGMQGLGLIVRPVKSYGLPEWVRVTVGSREQNERLLRELAAVR